MNHFSISKKDIHDDNIMRLSGEVRYNLLNGYTVVIWRHIEYKDYENERYNLNLMLGGFAIEYTGFPLINISEDTVLEVMNKINNLPPNITYVKTGIVTKDSLQALNKAFDDLEKGDKK